MLIIGWENKNGEIFNLSSLYFTVSIPIKKRNTQHQLRPSTRACNLVK